MSIERHLAYLCSSLIYTLFNLESESTDFPQQFLKFYNVYQYDYKFDLLRKLLFHSFPLLFTSSKKCCTLNIIDTNINGLFKYILEFISMVIEFIILKLF